MTLCVRCKTLEGRYPGYVYELGLHGRKKIKGKLCKPCHILSRGF